MLSLNDRQFWDIRIYPEIAELRAKRFGELDPHDQVALTNRIRKLPPRSLWSEQADADKIVNARLYWAVRELRRIEITGGSLPKRDKAWLDKNIRNFPDLLHSNWSDEGFLQSPRAQWVQPNPDSRYDLIIGKERLEALEAALASVESSWDDNPSERARDWIKQSENITKVLSDFESVPDDGDVFYRVWDWFGWTHLPSEKPGADLSNRHIPTECARVLSLIFKLPKTTARLAVEGISHWVYTWKKYVMDLPQGPEVWLKLWPIAIKATNERQSIEEDELLNPEFHSSNEDEPDDLDTLNSPAGKLIGVFLQACLDVKPGNMSFNEESFQRIMLMRDAIDESLIEPAGWIVKYRLIEHMPYFLAVDKQWTQNKLVRPLLGDNEEARTLWRAVARQRWVSPALMEILGENMVDRAIDLRLGRDTRRSLVFKIVFDCLHAFKEQRDPAVSFPRIQQMIRSLDDEVRIKAAETIVQFVRNVSAPMQGKLAPSSAEHLFRYVVAPFLQQVWPQERYLATPGVSQALAELPATTREAFAEAVSSIERFLMPFDCWSMIDYGFYSDENGTPNLSNIDGPEKGKAFLRLLDLTIGMAEWSVIPHDLSEALDQIRKVAPKLEQSTTFRRLATAARRD